MPKQVPAITDEILNLMRHHGRDAITWTWPQFYDLCEREKIKVAFQENLASDAKGRYQILMAYGSNAVVACRDFNFSPV